jgi:hypothetical protein
MRARENPFRSDRLLGLRYRLSETEWEVLIERLAALGNRAAIVGPRGSGKTTLLRDLAERLAVRHTVLNIRLNDVTPSIPWRTWRMLGDHDYVLLDGAERLGPSAWLAFSAATRNSSGVVITTHAPGRLPTLRECATSPELLAALVEELLGERPDWLDETALFERHRGNLRDALRALYDVFAS